MLLLKAIVYRVLRLLLLLIVSYIVLGSFTEALSISAIDAVIATIYYYYFDKFWDGIFRPLISNAMLRAKYRKMK